MLPPLIVIGLVATKRPALPSILFGALMGMLFAVWFQDASWQSVLATSKQGFSIQTDSAALNDLLSRGGLDKMMDTVALILCAVSFGGAMEAAGFLQTITRAILRLVHGTGSLVLVTICTAIGMNIIAGDQYIAIVLPGRMYKSTYEKMGLAPHNLSRALEDSATLTSPLVPWNTCGAFMAATLGVSPWLYLPWAFLNWFNPLVSIFYGFTGITMDRLPPKQEAAETAT
jgi:NhaC family Na+:H+ antiporter